MKIRTKIKEFVAKNGVEESCRIFNCCRETLRRYINCERTPRDIKKLEIQKSTDGIISITDWYLVKSDRK